MKIHIVIIMSILCFLIIFFVQKIQNKTDFNTVTIGFAGDTMIGRLVNEAIEKYGYTYPWGDILPLIHKSDIRIVNLETTVTMHEKAVPKVFNFKAFPDRVQTLQKAHINVVCLANNHILDFEEQGMNDTIAALDAANIQHVGAGKNIYEAQKAVVLIKNGIKIGVLGYTDNEPEWKAKKNKGGTNYVHVGDIEKLKPLIENLKKQVDVLIVSCHWGPNMRSKPSQHFITFAHALIDCGVDIIHGHSAHIFQGIEIYKERLIMYDTGDFVDDYAIDPILRNDQSLFFEVTIDKYGPRSVKLTPLLIKNMQVNKATKNESLIIMQKIQMLSRAFGTIISDDGIIKIR